MNDEQLGKLVESTRQLSNVLSTLNELRSDALQNSKFTEPQDNSRISLLEYQVQNLQRELKSKDEMILKYQRKIADRDRELIKVRKHRDELNKENEVLLNVNNELKEKRRKSSISKLLFPSSPSEDKHKNKSIANNNYNNTNHDYNYGDEDDDEDDEDDQTQLSTQLTFKKRKISGPKLIPGQTQTHLDSFANPQHNNRMSKSLSPLKSQKLLSMELIFKDDNDNDKENIKFGDEDGFIEDEDTELTQSETTEVSSQQQRGLIEDSQGDYDNHSSPFNILSSPLIISQQRKQNQQSQSQSNKLLNTSKSTKLTDFTKNPKTQSSWFPEHFKPNPTTNFGLSNAFKIRKMNVSLVHPSLQTLYKFEKEYIKNLQMKDFNKLSGIQPPPSSSSPTSSKYLTPVSSGKQPNNSITTTTTMYLPSPRTTPIDQLKNPLIDPIYKFELAGKLDTKSNKTNKTNDQDIVKYFKSDKIKLWLDLQDSPPGHQRSEFPTGSQVDRDNAEGVARSRIIGLRCLYQCLFMIQDVSNGNDTEDNAAFEQVGKFIFRNESWNDAVKSGKFTVDESIFYSC